jgi:hypothetical protein
MISHPTTATPTNSKRHTTAKPATVRSAPTAASSPKQYSSHNLAPGPRVSQAVHRQGGLQTLNDPKNGRNQHLPPKSLEEIQRSQPEQRFQDEMLKGQLCGDSGQHEIGSFNFIQLS